MRLETLDDAYAETTTYQYHANGQLLPSDNDAFFLDRAYNCDANGSRSGKEIDADGAYESPERYALDGGELVLAFDGATGAVSGRHLFGPGGEVLAEETRAAYPSDRVQWRLADRRDSVLTLLNNGATSLNHFASDANQPTRLRHHPPPRRGPLSSRREYHRRPQLLQAADP